MQITVNLTSYTYYQGFAAAFVPWLNDKVITRMPVSYALRLRSLPALLSLLMLLVLLPLGAIAIESEAERKIRDWTTALDKVETKLKRVDVSITELNEIRAELGTINTAAQGLRNELMPQLDEIKARFDKLGPAPKDDATEPETVANTRKEQKKLLEQAQAVVNNVDLIVLRSGQLDGRASEDQRRHFLDGLLSRTSSALNPVLWYDAAADLPDLFNRLKLLARGWLSENADKIGTWTYPLLAIVLAIAVLIGFPLRRRLQFMARPRLDTDEPAYARRITAAFGTALADIVPPLVAVWGTYGVLNAIGLLSVRPDRVALAAAVGLTAAIVIRGVARAILSPSTMKWRLGFMPDIAASRIYRLITLIAYVFAFDYFFTDMSSILFLPLPLTVAQSVLTAGALAFLFAGILLVKPGSRHHVTAPSTRQQFAWVMRFRSLFWLIIIAIGIALVFGFIALGRFMATHLVTTSLLIIVLYFLHLLADEILVTRLQPERSVGKVLQNVLMLSNRAVERFGLALATIIDIILLMIALPLIAMQLGVQWDDMQIWLNALFFGMDFGSIRISLSSILIAFGVFAAGLLLTRLFQRWLESRVLSRTQLDTGIRNSIGTGAGYTGVLLTALVAVSYAGVKFADIAIVAGALSVGIGFGLQSIVNNFVSGLILLAERPFKAGDWVVVGSDEGTVKKIKVRSTEIETFNRASVTVPNSKLITETVKNWTHRSKLGRIIIPVGVSYDCDPEKVRDILLGCAEDHEHILQSPNSYVVFRDFGDSALMFELRAFVDDINSSLTISSDLRFAIFRRLKEAGISIPFPQRDLHIVSGGEALKGKD